jgi:hypothetical protein
VNVPSGAKDFSQLQFAVVDFPVVRSPAVVLDPHEYQYDEAHHYYNHHHAHWHNHRCCVPQGRYGRVSTEQARRRDA